MHTMQIRLMKIMGIIITRVMQNLFGASLSELCHAFAAASDQLSE